MTVAKVFINSQIGNTYDPETGDLLVKGVELAEVILEANAKKDAEILEFWIDSGGGDVIVGRAIRDYISSLSNAWTIAGEFCASMGTEIALAVPLERRKKVAGGKYIIHNPWLSVSGDAATLHEAADYVEKYETEMLAMYSKATGMDKEAIRPLMALETSLTDEQCKAFNFVSEIIPKAELKPLAFVSKKTSNQTNTTDMDKKINAAVDSKFDAFLKKLGIKKPEAAAAASTTAAAATKTSVKAVKKPAAPKAEVVMTDADVSIYTSIPLADFVADPSKECKVFSDEAMQTPLADGTYNLKDGSVIVVASGIVEEYTPGEVEASAEEVVALKAENERLKAESADLETRLRAEFNETLDAKLDELQELIGSNYKPSAEVKTTTATRGTTTVLAKKGDQELSMKEKAELRRQGYKGASKPAAAKA